MTEEQSKGAALVMKTLFSVDTYHPWLVDLPDTSLKIPLTELHGFGKHGFASGRYEDGAERGTVNIAYPDIFALKLGDPAREMYFTVPYSISNQGSGIFWYLGLFRYDNGFKAVNQIDWVYLGDRIAWHAVRSTSLGPNWLKLQFSWLDHADYQSLSENPNHLVTRVVDVSPHGFGRVKRPSGI
ncbi:hypothetical protein NF212_07310 [Parasalinivibrio latis]|uniref:hypothetical protein n=1 Tax=Parasalinivibrio latis TaxID=2952610 RepID=UPI0030E03319